jgi:hypothetical protein
MTLEKIVYSPIVRIISILGFTKSLPIPIPSGEMVQKIG